MKNFEIINFKKQVIAFVVKKNIRPPKLLFLAKKKIHFNLGIL